MSKYSAWKSFEGDIVRQMKKLGWKNAKRNWSEQFDKKSKKDILNTEPYVFQCKYGIRPNIIKAWEEAKKASKKNEIAVGIIRFKGTKKTLVCMSWKDFEKYIKSLLIKVIK